MNRDIRQTKHIDISLCQKHIHQIILVTQTLKQLL